MAMIPSAARGQCLCGVIKFTARFPSKWVAHCHCTRCQRAHGAAFVTREPQMHGYYDTHVAWARVSDDLPTKPDPSAQ